jgi:hypothetical protein
MFLPDSTVNEIVDPIVKDMVDGVHAHREITVPFQVDYSGSI